MKERPILFQGAMVRALLAGTKTQTRRMLKPDGKYRLDLVCPTDGGPPRCPYGQPGDRLWVRESHWWFKDKPDHETGYYPPPLDIDDVEYRADGDDGRKVWRPSIHMPRWASRITLEVIGVLVERLQDISDADALTEGVDRTNTSIPGYARQRFEKLWESINGPGSWAANPWVWVVEFKRLEAA